MTGQLTVFDIGTEADRRPCRYRFKRYVGQKVRMMFGAYPGIVRVGRIREISDSYYTIVRIGNRDFVGTPYNLSPADEGSME